MTSITCTVDIIRIGSDEQGTTVGKLSLIPTNIPTGSMMPMYNEFGPVRFDIGGLPAAFVNGVQRGDVLTISLAAQE